MKRIILCLTFLIILINTYGCSINTKKPTDVDLKPVTIEDIYVYKLPNDVVYYQDQDINIDGLVIKAKNEKEYEIIVNDYKVEPYNNKQLGEQEINISWVYNDKTYYTSFKVTFVEKVFINLELRKLPLKQLYYIGEDLDLTGLELYAIYDEFEELITDYKITEIDNFTTGIKNVELKWQEETSLFQVEYITPLCSLVTLSDKSKSIYDINTSDIVCTINNVKNGGLCGSNEIVLYDYNNYQKNSNIGCELILNEDSRIIGKKNESGNISDGYVLSIGKNNVNNLNNNLKIGDFIYLNKVSSVINVYRNPFISDTYKFTQVLENASLYIHALDNNSMIFKEYIDLYNPIILKYNELIDKYQFLNEEQRTIIISYLEEALSKNTISEVKEVYTYSYAELNNNTVNTTLGINASNYYSDELIYTVNDILHGGFRDTNRTCYYDANNYRKANKYGFEIAVDSNQIVIAKDILVTLPTGGFILSGHSEAGSLLSNNINIGDKVVYDRTNNCAYVYRNLVTSRLFCLEKSLNSKINEVKAKQEQLIPLDYNMITNNLNKAVKTINNIINDFNSTNVPFMRLHNIESDLDYLEETVLILDFLLIEKSPQMVEGVWHYPTTLTNYGYPEKTLSDVEKLLDYYVDLGINTIYLLTNNGGYAYYPSKYIPTKVIRTTYDYGEYGNDYVKCFTEEAKIRNLSVVAFTQAVMCGDGSIPQHIKDEWVVKNYQGQNVGNVYLFDLFNDEVWSLLVNIYTELVTEYDFSGIEFDIIRYPTSRLYQHLETTTPLSASDINDNGYTTSAINKFMAKYGYTGNMKELILASKDVRSNWLTFKQERVSEFVKTIANIFKTIRPNIFVTAAVMPNPTSAKNAYMQDWATWYNEGYLDMIDPMVYTASDEEVVTRILDIKRLVSNELPINVGISPLISDGTINQLATQINSTFTNNAYGYVVFASRNIFRNESLLKALNLRNTYNTISPYCDISKKYQLIINDMIDKIEGYYIKVDDLIDYESILTILKSINSLDEYYQKLPEIKRLLSSNQLVLNHFKLS